MPAATPQPSNTERLRAPTRKVRDNQAATAAAMCELAPSRPMLPPEPMVQIEDRICTMLSRIRMVPLRSCTMPMMSVMPNART